MPCIIIDHKSCDTFRFTIPKMGFPIHDMYLNLITSYFSFNNLTNKFGIQDIVFKN